MHRTHSDTNNNKIDNKNINENKVIDERNQASAFQESRIQELKEHSAAITLKYAITFFTLFSDTLLHILGFFLLQIKLSIIHDNYSRVISFLHLTKFRLFLHPNYVQKWSVYGDVMTLANCFVICVGVDSIYVPLNLYDWFFCCCISLLGTRLFLRIFRT